MPYATLQDITDRYGEDLQHNLVNQSASDDSAALTGIVERALGDASEEVNLYLRGRVVVPLTVVPEVIRRVVVDLALAMLPTEGAGDNDLVQDRAKAARKLLSTIASGALDLGLPAPAGAAGGGGVQFSGPGQIFTADALQGY